MAKTFGTMKTNVGNIVQNTDATFGGLIGGWINDRYREISRKMAWSGLIDDDNTFALVVGTSSYTLPTAFDHEIFVANITDGILLKRLTEGIWWRERYSAHNAGVISNGTSRRYVILREANKIKVDPPPDAVKTLAFPFKKTITELSATGDTTVIADIERAIEFGAAADAFAYLKFMAQSNYYEQKYAIELADRMGQEKANINQLYQMISENYKLDQIFRLTGETSYDTI